MVVRIEYRAWIVVVGLLLFSASAVWLYLGPDTQGVVGRTFGGAGRVTIIGAGAIACSLAMSALYGIYSARILLGRPALDADTEELRIHVFPFQKLNLSEVEEISLVDGEIVIARTLGRTRKLRLSILKDSEEGVEGLRSLVKSAASPTEAR